MRLRMFLAGVLLVLFTYTAVADVLVLKNGQKLRGKVVERTAAKVVLEVAPGIRTSYPMTLVSEVVIEDAQPRAQESPDTQPVSQPSGRESKDPDGLIRCGLIPFLQGAFPIRHTPFMDQRDLEQYIEFKGIYRSRFSVPISNPTGFLPTMEIDASNAQIIWIAPEVGDPLWDRQDPLQVRTWSVPLPENIVAKLKEGQLEISLCKIYWRRKPLSEYKLDGEYALNKTLGQRSRQLRTAGDDEGAILLENAAYDLHHIWKLRKDLAESVIVMIVKDKDWRTRVPECPSVPLRADVVEVIWHDLWAAAMHRDNKTWRAALRAVRLRPSSVSRPDLFEEYKQRQCGNVILCRLVGIGTDTH